MMGWIARFVPSLFSVLPAFLNPWVWGTLLVVLLGGFAAGWTVQGWRWDASLTKQAEQNLKIVQDHFAKQRTNNATVAARLNAAWGPGVDCRGVLT
ncbi:MAG: hypothetical protein AABM33_05965 [Pseudomonadota bacterium]